MLWRRVDHRSSEPQQHRLLAACTRFYHQSNCRLAASWGHTAYERATNTIVNIQTCRRALHNDALPFLASLCDNLFPQPFELFGEALEQNYDRKCAV